MADGDLQEIGVPRSWWDREGSLRFHTVPRDFPLLHRFQGGRSSCTNACAPDTTAQPTAATAHASALTAANVCAHTYAADFRAYASSDDAAAHTSASARAMQAAT